MLALKFKIKTSYSNIILTYIFNIYIYSYYSAQQIFIPYSFINPKGYPTLTQLCMFLDCCGKPDMEELRNQW